VIRSEQSALSAHPPELESEEVRLLGERYLAETRVYRLGKPQAVPFFIDKMPNNFRHLGLIRLMLPNARIIDARREPIACCFSNLKQLYAKGQEFTYSIEDIARYYRTYLELMRHWDAVLPVDPAGKARGCRRGSGRQRAAHAGVLRPGIRAAVHRVLQDRAQCTYGQFGAGRQPIYREGLEQWKNFEPWLEPLRMALGDALMRYRDA